LKRILIVEDDPSISELIDMNLSVAGFECEMVFDGAQAVSAIHRQQYDLALLDIMLPELDGFELMPHMQQQGIPVIYVSAKSDVADRVRGLRLGAEDYLVKPFDILELLVRIEKVLQRTGAPPSELFVCGVTVNEAERKTVANGDEIELKPMEYALMLMFMRHPNIVLSREQLLHEVWGDEYLGETRTVDSHVAALRKKLNWQDRIVTVHRVGYKLEAGR
jgi:DNA-binding response OmpR family regulator